MTETENSTTPPPPTKDELVREIAKVISDRRKTRNLTLEKVFQSIKIRIPYLQAIESGRWDQLPAEVYIRSFIKRYADHLGLDGEKLLAPYFEMNKAPEKNTVPQILKGSEISRIQVIGIAMVGIVVIVLIKFLSQEKSPTQTTSDVIVPVMASSATVSNPPATGLLPMATLPSGAGMHQLDVFSPNSLWLRVASKDKNFEGFIPESATWTWKAEGSFSVRLGHTLGVSLHFDGKPVFLQENQKKVELP